MSAARRGAVAGLAPSRRERCALGARHFGGRDKPWLVHYTRCMQWFDFLNKTSGISRERSRCVQFLEHQRRRAERKPPITKWNPCGNKCNECVL